VVKKIKSQNDVVLAHIWLCEGATLMPQSQSQVFLPSEIDDVLAKFSHVFDPAVALPPPRDIDHAIPLLLLAKPVNL
jgi:hypothetical protein